MSSLLEHAEREFELAGWKEKDDKMQNLMMDNTRELLKTFSKQGHSGFSAKYVLGLFDCLANFEIITPLTGKDNEWIKVKKGLLQNKRDSRVFEENGKAYFIEGKAFSDDGGRTFFTNKDSIIPVTFPCKPEDLKTERIIVGDYNPKEEEECY